MTAISARSASEEAADLFTRDGPPMFVADWVAATFMHFTVDVDRLQREVPLELDTHDGRAFVSLIAFTQRDLRPIALGRFARLLAFPVATHTFLNLRTYVRRGSDRGIFFLAEWIPNVIARLIGPATYGLPFHLAKLRYATTPIAGKVGGIVTAGRRAFAFSAQLAEPAQTNPLDEFLIERYCAFTASSGGKILRRFRIHHQPWPIVPASFAIARDDLIRQHAPWFADAVPIGGHYSPGVTSVRIGRPVRFQQAEMHI